MAAMSSPDKNSQNTSTGNTYNGAVSFQYPSDWQLSQGSGGSHMAIVKNGGGDGNEIGIDILSVGIVDEKTSLVVDGYAFNGKKEISGIKCYIYQNNEGYDAYHQTVYLFEKSGKVIEIVGNLSYDYVMEKIVSTIQ
jgi:hypothetical protein